VLFSEPKIPQSPRRRTAPAQRRRRFSALQRAENSSIGMGSRLSRSLLRFQCSSASRKFLNNICFSFIYTRCCEFQCSSASRKFLNPMSFVGALFARMFQCSSASRKFLNGTSTECPKPASTGFSALQRAENSSIQQTQCRHRVRPVVSVLFSEPKIPQWFRPRTYT